MAALISIPWTMKPIFGFIFDQIMKKLKKSKYLVFITAVIKILCYLSLGFFKTPTWLFYIIFFIITMSNLFLSIICEYLLVISSQKANEEIEDGTENHLPIFYGFRCAGTVIGNLVGGEIIGAFGLFLNFFIASFIPLISVVISIITEERRKTSENKRSVF